MQPTGMSVNRCVAALTGLSGELDRVASYSDHLPDAGLPPSWSLRALILDLSLDIDLRRDAAAKSFMSAIESEVYLPVIRDVLSLLRLAEAGETETHPLAEAKERTQGALRTAVKLAAESGE
jgi:hypothetical protein